MTDSEQQVLAAMPGNNKEITERTGMKGRRVNEITRRLCLRSEAHICGYQRRPLGGVPHPIFAKGKGVTARLLEPSTPSGLRNRRTKKAEIDEFAEVRARLFARESKTVRAQATWISPLLATTKKGITCLF